MGAKKIKISKKEVQKARRAEELAEVPILSREWIEEHTNKILIGLAALLLLLGGVWGFNAYGASQERQARLEYARVLQSWPGGPGADQQAWHQIIAALETYVRKYPDTPSAKDAELDLARAYFQTQQFDKAQKAGKNVLDQATRNQTLKLLAQYQLAFIYEALNRTEDALAQWQALGALETSELRKEALWNMARLYAKQGDHAKAAEYGELAMKAPGSYPDPAILQTELASLKPGSQQPAIQ